MPSPFMCHWCDKPTMNEAGICIECEQRYEEGNKEIAETVRELETRVSWLEKGLKLVIKIANDKESGLVMAAQAVLDGEPTTADKHNDVISQYEDHEIQSEIKKAQAKEWHNEGHSEWNRDREEKIKKKANMIQSIGYRGEDE